MNPSPDYRRKGVKVSNVAKAEHRKLVLRLVVTCLGSTYRWRVLAWDTVRAGGTCATRKAAMIEGQVAMKVLREKGV